VIELYSVEGGEPPPDVVAESMSLLDTLRIRLDPAAPPTSR